MRGDGQFIQTFEGGGLAEPRVPKFLYLENILIGRAELGGPLL